MGYAPKEKIQVAAEWLLNKLQMQNPIRYSEMYETGELERAGQLHGFDDFEPFSVMVDCAVHQLAEKGIVTRTELEHVMSDDTNDYEIFMTWQSLERKPEMVGMDL